MRAGFDNEVYLKEQKDAILECVRNCDNKLYLEFGGKLLFDHHAARILPGFDPNVKMRLLQELKDRTDIILCIHAGDIERKKMRADFGITYDADALKLIDDLRGWGIDVTAVVITRFSEQPAARAFKNRLERQGICVHTHRPIHGYPTDIDLIVSDKGYGANTYVETDKPLVVVTGPGPGSGKLSTCLSQLHHEHCRSIAAGYAKFETFPIWNLPLGHPLNIAYEAATADLHDVNMIDAFHLDAYGTTAVNYNRDIELFPVVRSILERVTGRASTYRSPTDMGVNRAGFAILDDAVVRHAACQELIRRLFRYRCEYAMGLADRETVDRVKVLMEQAGARVDDRAVVAAARQAAAVARQAGKGNEGIFCGAAIELPDDTLICGKNSPLMHAASSTVLNAIKHLARIPDEIHLLSPAVIDSIRVYKQELSGKQNASLDLQETLIALSISVTTNPTAQHAMHTLKRLRGCQVHLTHMPTPGDEIGLRRLGVELTSDPDFPSKNLLLT